MPRSAHLAARAEFFVVAELLLLNEAELTELLRATGARAEAATTSEPITTSAHLFEDLVRVHGRLQGLLLAALATTDAFKLALQSRRLALLFKARAHPSLELVAEALLYGVHFLILIFSVACGIFVVADVDD